MFEKYTELFKSVAFILMNLHSLVPSNVYDVFSCQGWTEAGWTESQGRKLVGIDNMKKKLE